MASVATIAGSTGSSSCTTAPPYVAVSASCHSVLSPLPLYLYQPSRSSRSPPELSSELMQTYDDSRSVPSSDSSLTARGAAREGSSHLDVVSLRAFENYSLNKYQCDGASTSASISSGPGFLSSVSSSEGWYSSERSFMQNSSNLSVPVQVERIERRCGKTDLHSVENLRAREVALKNIADTALMRSEEALMRSQKNLAKSRQLLGLLGLASKCSSDELPPASRANRDEDQNPTSCLMNAGCLQDGGAATSNCCSANQHAEIIEYEDSDVTFAHEYQSEVIVPNHSIERKFSEQRLDRLRTVFSSCDLDGNHILDSTELEQALQAIRACGLDNVNESKVQVMLSDVGGRTGCCIEWPKFLFLMSKTGVDTEDDSGEHDEFHLQDQQNLDAESGHSKSCIQIRDFAPATSR